MDFVLKEEVQHNSVVTLGRDRDGDIALEVEGVSVLWLRRDGRLGLNQYLNDSEAAQTLDKAGVVLEMCGDGNNFLRIRVGG